VKEQSFPKVSFGIIVLNGEPFTRYCLRALYRFAHEIIVVEGAAPGAAEVATPDGHSRDSTLKVLHQFKTSEDPDDKLIIITRDGFWSEKDEMSQAYAERASGDYLWQIDVDEFYKADEMERVIAMLRDDPSITAVSFKMVTFWGGFDYTCDGWYLKSGAEIYHRLFKWGPDYTYVTHRPPTVHDAQGRDLRTLHWIDGYALARKTSIEMYHYSLLFPHQVIGKSNYYEHSAMRAGSNRWAQENYLALQRPFRVHNVHFFPSWLERFIGEHPEQIQRLQNDIRQGTIQVRMRQTEDVERLLNSPSYQWSRRMYKHTPRSVQSVHAVVMKMYSAMRRRLITPGAPSR
jgi:hypothetical protein